MDTPDSSYQGKLSVLEQLCRDGELAPLAPRFRAMSTPTTAFQLRHEYSSVWTMSALVPG